MLWAERIAPGHALAAVMGSLDAPLYALENLSPRSFAEGFPGDVRTLVYDLHERRSAYGTASLDDIRQHVRIRSTLNLLDAALWSETVGLLGDHVWRGEADVRVRWLQLAGARVLPSVRYELSPLGPEYYVRTLYRAFGASGTAYGRWTERIGPNRQVGGGFSLSRWSTPRIRAERQRRRLVARRRGVRDARRGRSRCPRLAGRARRPDGRGRGKVLRLPCGFAMDGGAYITAGVTVRVW